MPELVARLLLPFSVSAKDRMLAFTDEMELATVFFMAESDRRKSEGLILKKPPEKLAFITKSCYPIWLAPSNGKTLVFDGLGVSTHILPYEVLPDVAEFINGIQVSATRRETYAAALAGHARYFESVTSLEKKSIAGLITNPDFVQDFQTYLIEAEEADESAIRSEHCLSTLVDESAIVSAVEEISELSISLDKDLQSLREAMKLITDTTKNQVNTIREEARQIQMDLTERIAAAKASAMEKVAQIQEKFDARIIKTSQKYDQQIQELHQERVKLEKAQDRVFVQVEESENEIAASKGRKDEAGERRWKEEKDKWKREIAASKEKIKDLDRQIKETESEKNIEISNLRTEFSAQSEAEMRDVRELEAEKESKTQLSQKEIKSLEDSTSAIVQQLETLVKRKRMAFEQCGVIAMHTSRRQVVVAYLPFYLACFQAGDQRRYMVYPPAVVGSMKKVTKFKSMLGASKMKSLFQQRSRALTGVLDNLTLAIERNPVFKKEIHDLGAHANILQPAESRARIARGLEELRNEEWLSSTEVQTLGDLLKKALVT